jgi:predicted nucleic acid-binding protein
MRIYLDTNVLIKEGWPDISVKLREMLILARASQIGVVVPEAVEREVKAHWFRELKKRLMELAKAEYAFSAKIEALGLDSNPTTEELFDFEFALSKYAEVVEELKTEWGIVSAPLPSVALDRLFQMAIDKEALFEDCVSGFQDTVVLFSAIDDLVQFPGESGILLSDDKVFSQKGTQDLVARLSADLNVHRSVADAIAILKSNLDDYLRQQWDGDERIAVAEMWRQKHEIEAFVRESFNRDQSLLMRPKDDRSSIVVQSVELRDVTAVFVPQPEPREGRTEEQSVRIAAAVRCLIRVDFRKLSGIDIFQPISWVIPIEIEADAMRAGGRYTIAKYIRARPAYEPEDGL